MWTRRRWVAFFTTGETTTSKITQGCKSLEAQLWNCPALMQMEGNTEIQVKMFHPVETQLDQVQLQSIEDTYRGLRHVNKVRCGTVN
jgi:hypothetical protein